MDKMYSFNEIGLIPSSVSYIKSRSKVFTRIDGGMHNLKLPIFVSPMTCIIDDTSFKNFDNAGVIPIYPRRSDSTFIGDDKWRSYSLSDFQKFFVDESTRVEKPNHLSYRVLIDVANGHMSSIYDLIQKAKKYYSNNLIIMMGNIANPEAYYECARCGVNYIRVGIGGGNACSTSVLTGIHASLPWLITEMVKIKKKISSESYPYMSLPRIVADGGIDTIDKAIKALALGANYVMMGKTFAKCSEACGKVFVDNNGEIWREYYGMASTRGQQDISGGVTKASEGIITRVKVEYSLEEYLNKFDAALRSCMSYTNSSTLYDFIGNVHYEIMSPLEFNSYYKYEIE